MPKITFVIFGLIYLIYGLRYPFWDEGQPGTGFFPRLISFGILLLGFISCVGPDTGIFEKYKLRRFRSIFISDIKNKIPRDALIMLLVLIISNIFLSLLGFILSTTILGFITAYLSGCKKSLVGFVVGLVIALGSYIIFEKLFLISLPKGILWP